MLRSLQKLLFFSIISIFSFKLQAQNSVGIGTENPNENAVLQLVSPNSDQGLLIPKLTTAQRLAPAFLSRLGSNENGLMVFDSDENQFYFWLNTQWQPVSTTANLVAGTGIGITGNTINNLGDSDADPQNEIQDLQLTGSTLTITNNASATPVDLSGLSGAAPQTLATQKTGSNVDISISDGNTVVVNVDDGDNDAGNELQDLTLTGTDLSISSGSTISLSTFLDNTDNQVAGNVPVTPGGNLTATDVQAALIELQSDIDSDGDADASNEIQIATGVPVTPGGNLSSLNVQNALLELQSDIDLDLDDDPVNEIQNISISGNAIGIDGGGTGFTITPSAPSPNQVLKWNGSQWIAGSDDTGVGTLPALSDAQLITNNGSNIAVSVAGDISMNNAGVMSIQPGVVSSTEIADGSVSNVDISGVANISSTKLESLVMLEGEDLSLLNNDAGFLTIVNNSDITDVDPSKLTQAGALSGQALKWSGAAWLPANDLVDDADNDPVNEIQDLSLAGNTLSLTGDGTTVDLTGYLDDTDNQDLSLTLNTLSLTNDASPVDLSGYLDNTDNQDLSLTLNTLSLTNDASPVDLSGYLDNTDNQNASQVPVTPSGSLTSINTQAALEELQLDIDADTDSDPSNEYQDLTFATDIIGLTNSLSTVNLSGYMDNTDNQNASQVPVAPSGNLTSTNTQTALEELQSDIDIDLDQDATNEYNLGGSLEANNLLRIVDNGGNTDIDISRLTGNLDANTNLINNLTNPVAGQDAATKAYVDGQLSTGAWGTVGNSGTTAGTNYIGTTDAQDLVLATNGSQNMRIFNGTGNVSIGNLDAGQNTGFGANDRFLTLSNAEFPGSTGVSSIELSGYSSGFANEIGRLDFNTRVSGVSNLIARISAARVGLATQGELRLGTHNGTVFTNHVIIDENGNVGVGSANPGAKLDVVGTLRTTGFLLSTTPTNGYVMTSNASGVGTWQPVPTAFSTANTIPKGNGSGLINSIIVDDGAGHIGINAPTPTAGLHLISLDGVRFSGALGGGTIPATGAGTRMMWYPGKAAFRAGRTTATDWDDTNIANYSVAIGYNGIASGEAAVSLGYDNDVAAFRSVGIGTGNLVNQQQSFAAGVNNTINGQQSLALGIGNSAGGQFSGTIGWDAVASQDSAFAMGAWVEGSNIASYVIGKGVETAKPLVNNIRNSLMVGFHSTVPTFYVGPSFGEGTTGSVGIGTSSPQQKLDVNGAIRSTGFILSTSPSANYVLTSNAFGAGTWQPIPSQFSTNNYIPRGDGSAMVSSDLYNDSGSGNVSVGSTNAYNRFSIVQNVGTSVDQGAFIDIQNTQGSNNAMSGLRFKVNSVTANQRYGGGIWHRFNTAYELVFAVKDNSTSANVSSSDIKMVIRDDGNVGIGVAIPSERLEVNGNIVGQSLRDPNNSLTNFVSWDPGGQFRIMNNGNTLMFAETDGRVRIGVQSVPSLAKLTVQGSGSGSNESFRTQNQFGIAQFVVLDNGRVGIDTSSPGWSLEVNGSAAKPGGGSWTDASDKRLKRNIEDYSDGLEKVLNINPVTYQFKPGYNRDPNQIHVGVIAQEMKEILPYTITVKDENIGDIENPMIYDASALPYVLINAVKELHSENQKLKEQLELQNELMTRINTKLELMESLITETSINNDTQRSGDEK